MERISFNLMCKEMTTRSERGLPSTISFYKQNGELTNKQVLWGAPRTIEAKEKRATITKKGEQKREFRQGKLVLTDFTTKTLITPFSRLIVKFENKEVWH
jgi:hypothetical protein